ncbi:MAG: SPASM domain-containing protein, partial [Candidatus Sumerlaeaceae bacterium]
TTHFTVEMLKTKRKLVDCVSAGQNVAVLYATGELALCEFSKPFGNVRDYGFDFARAWNSPEAEAMRRATSRCWCTHGCYLSKNIEYSFAGLRAMLRKL